MRQVQVAPHLSIEELEGRYRRAQEPHERSWWQILWLLTRGRTARQVAESTGYSAYWIGQLARRYNTQGPDAMRNRQRFAAGGSYRRPMLLSDAQQNELREALAGPPPGAEDTAGGDGELWTARAVAEWMSARLGRPIAVQRGWDYLQRLRQSPQVPRPTHTQADPAAQAAFKKNSARS